jgi:Tfp pilus assembly protein PilX
MHTQRRQRGVALLISIFGLVLISFLALAMLFSSDTETTISANYRDKQSAIYGALAGLQEVRDRLHPCNGDLSLGAGGNCTSGGLNIAPTALASLSAKNVLYIINPAPGEVVAPWNPSNPYFDTELCKENILGLTSNGSGPCTAAPSGSSWYQVYDNSSNSTSWQLHDAIGNRIPLPYKWVRVTLKSDNSTPVTVGTGNGTQVCWDGAHEQQIKTGYHADCTPARDGVTNIAVTASGWGYTSAPNVTISGGGGSGATATAHVSQLPTGVTSVTLTGGGSGYTTAPNVQVVSSDGSGSGAVVAASLNNTVPVQSVTINPGNPPSCYPAGSALQPVFNPAGASGSVQLTGNRCVYSFSANGVCSRNVTANVTANGGSGGGFSGQITFGGNKKPTNVTLISPGNYSTVPSTFNVDHGCSGVTITPVYGVQVQGVTVPNGSGGAYQAGQPVNVTFAGAAAAKGSVGNTTGTGNLAAGSGSGSVVKLTIVNSGAGYTANPILVIDPPPAGGSSSPATGTAAISPSQGVTSISVTNAGSGYTSNPAVTLSGGGGTGAAATASIGGTGNFMGRVYLLTALAQTQSGARAMAQMEVGVTYQQYSISLGGALTMAGPSPTFGTPNAQNFVMNGNDANSCGQTAYPAKPAIGVFDDPNNPTSPTAVASVLNALGKPNNYIGAHAAPDIENSYGTLGGLTAEGLNAFVQSVAAVATNTYGSNPGNINLGSATNPAIDFVNGNYTMGPTTGYGILVVTGTLTFSGDYSWNGLILVIGNGASIMNGGGNGQVNGAVFLANTAGGTLGSPVADWTGGGGNGVQYDHCWADNMLAKVPYAPSISSSGLKVISLRMLQY